MSSAYGPESPRENASNEDSVASRQTMECQLFESLVHHLIEKGVLTKHDALSVVQTVTQVRREIDEGVPRTAAIENELTYLNRLYSSFKLLRDQPSPHQLMDGEQVIRLGHPLHSDRPEFPFED